MKIIIDIPDKIFHRVCQDYLNYSETTEGQALKAISEGIPLPKGHGRLIDEEELKKTIRENDVLSMRGFVIRLCDIENTPTIIEADKEYEAKVITRGNCMLCGKELTEGLFFCKECGEKSKQAESEDKV